jgi:hypothetical protein
LRVVTQPRFFVELISLSFKREDEERRDLAETDRAMASTAYDVLDSWKSMPGVVNGQVDAQEITAWVAAALKKGAAEGRKTITSQQVGRVLCYSPMGTDGAWPHEAVREVIDTLQHREVETGFEIGTHNKRGVVTRSLDEGGRQERALADQFGSWADGTRDRWPRTAAILRMIESSYRDEALREDREADLR